VSGPSRMTRLFNATCRALVRPQFSPEVPIAKLRRRMRQRTALSTIPPRGPRAQAERLGDVPTLRYGPALGDAERVLLYLHGGGWVLPQLQIHDHFCIRAAAHLGCTVLLPEYRLAPEHPFPAAPEDCFAAYAALLERGVDPARLLVAGDSAGGNLALVTLCTARDEGFPLPAGAVLFSPSTDLRCAAPSWRENDGVDPFFRALSVRGLMLTRYVQDRAPLDDRRLSPLAGDLSGLPPCLFFAGSTEILRDDSVLAAAKINASGGQAEVRVVPEVPHVFPLFSVLPEGRQATREAFAFLEGCLATAPGAAGSSRPGPAA